MKSKTKLDLLIEQVEKKLEKALYSTHAQKSYRTYFNNIRKYALTKGDDGFTDELGADYLKETYNFPFKPVGRLCTTVQNASRAVELLSSFQKTGEFSKRKKRRQERVPQNLECVKMIENYIEDIQPNHKGDEPLVQHRNTVIEFLDYLYDNGISDLQYLNANHVSDFLKTFINIPRNSRKAKLSHLRCFLRFLYIQEFTQINLVLALPSLRLGGQKYVPITFTSDETEAFFAAVDRTKAHGKRDYAIMQILSQLGLRSGDVRNLKFENIDWEKGIFCIQQEKTSHFIELPISEEIGSSLIDYLKNGRPHSDSEFVFIRHSAPFEPLSCLTDICRRYMKTVKHGVQPGVWGLHAFRHTLASRLLAENVGPQIIAQILGHSNSRTVGEYLHIDFKKLEMCALDPEEVFADEQL